MNLLKDLWSHIKEWSDWKMKDWIKSRYCSDRSYLDIKLDDRRSSIVLQSSWRHRLGGKGGALKTIAKVVDEIHTSEEEKLDKKILMQRIQQKLAEKQLDVNAKEASHRSVFVAGWRPFIGWIGGLALMFEFILSPCIEWYAKFAGLNLTAPEIQDWAPSSHCHFNARSRRDEKFREGKGSY